MKNKTEYDLLWKERKARKELLKTNPNLKKYSKIKFFDRVESFLTDLAESTDNKHPREGGFKKQELDTISGYLMMIQKFLIPK